MQLVPLDALVASWILQSALGLVFLISLWGMAASFGRREVGALAVGWTFYLVTMLASMTSSIVTRQHGAHTAVAAAGMIEGAAAVFMVVFWYPMAGFLAGTRGSVTPSRRAITGAVALLLVINWIAFSVGV